MPTITAGSSVEIDIAVGDSYAVTTPGEAYVDIVSGTAGAGYKTDRLIGGSQRTQIYGPYKAAVKIRVRARTGGATYYSVPKEQPDSPDLVDVKARYSAQGVGFTSTMQLTQAQYDALAVKDAAVMYVIVG